MRNYGKGTIFNMRFGLLLQAVEKYFMSRPN